MKIKPLQAHDKAALICPASICLSPDHPQIAADYLKQHHQLSAVFGKDTTRALSAQQRAEIFLQYLFDDDIKLISALRGGEGSADIIPLIHQYTDRIKQLPPKWLLGFSDITALLLYFSKHYRWPVIHGSGPLQYALNKADTYTEQSTMKLLFEHSHDTLTTLSKLTPLNDHAQQNTSIEAELTGGCLSLINISIKDLWEINADQHIIFIEDIDEKAHQIDRTLKYLSRIGTFQHAKAIIFGDFTYSFINDPDNKKQAHAKSILKTLSQFAQQQHYPVLYTTEFGHGQTNVPLLYATPYQLTLGDKPLLTQNKGGKSHHASR